MKFHVPKPVKPNNWRDAVKMPILRGTKNGWDLDTFERKLDDSIRTCFEYALEKNKGVIFTTLSGGLDSSLCLAKIWRMAKEYPGSEIVTLSIGGSMDHPDLFFARLVSYQFQTKFHEYIPTPGDIQKARRAIFHLWPNDGIMRGDIAVFLIYQRLSRLDPRVVIAHDGIDELLGGYSDHRFTTNQEWAFTVNWGSLARNHLMPLEKKAHHFGIEVVFPYLQKGLVKYISKIPLSERTNREESKIPLRKIAKKYLPEDIITRTKIGFCDALR